MILLDSEEPSPGTIMVDSIPGRCYQQRAGKECGGKFGHESYWLAGGGMCLSASCSRCGRLYKVMDDDDEDA